MINLDSQWINWFYNFVFDNFDHMLLSHGIWSQRSLKNRRVQGLNFAIPTYLGIVSNLAISTYLATLALCSNYLKETKNEKQQIFD